MSKSELKRLKALGRACPVCGTLGKVEGDETKHFVPDYTAREIDDICFNIYMSYHVSEMGKKNNAVNKAWKRGQEIHEMLTKAANEALETNK